MYTRIRATTEPGIGTFTARHRRAILAFTLVTAGLALVVSLRKSAVYSSDARVLVRFQSSEAALVVPIADGASLQTERTLALSRSVALTAGDRLSASGAPSDPQGLLVGLLVRAIPGTEILEFEYTHPVPEIAQERAQAFAEAYLLFRQRDQQRAAGYGAERVAAEVALLEQHLNSINARIGATRDESRLAGLETQATTVLKWLVEKEIELADESYLPPVGEVLEPADLPVVASGPNHLANGLVGLIVGLVGGIVYTGVRFR
jgi:uncharacterized protein involved in exopolysaccharide biosynthesis